MKIPVEEQYKYVLTTALSTNDTGNTQLGGYL